ncbi:MAG TPA: hypothetical protein VFF06_01270, partial [Polyangia bacterium]|nr:hypothetical protein [Polyangia bacterium]
MKIFVSCAALVLSSCTMSLPDSLDGNFHHDMARADDLAVPDLGDSCTQVATWPAMFAAAGFDPTQGDTFTLAAQQSAEPQNILALEDWHTNAAET